eukprot:5992165-Karenia_brevis.AAC.1
MLDNTYHDQYWSFLDEIEDDQQQASTRANIVLEVLNVQVDFLRSFAHPIRIYPLLLFWIVWSPPDEPCPLRKQFAQDFIMQSFESINDASSKKIRILFHSELTECAKSGCVDNYLWE